MDDEAAAPATATDWPAIRAAYESRDNTIADIARLHRVSTKTLHNHAVKGGWMLRNPHRAIDRSAIIGRMFRLLDRQIIQLEHDMTSTGEKEVAVLGKLASTLEKLIDIDNTETADKPKPGQGKDMRDLRNKLAARIEQLKRG